MYSADFIRKHIPWYILINSQISKTIYKLYTRYVTDILYMKFQIIIALRYFLAQQLWPLINQDR